MLERHAARLGQFLAQSLHLLAFQPCDKVSWQDESSVRLARSMAGLDEPFATSVESPHHVVTEARFDEAHPITRPEVSVEPGRPVTTNLLIEVKGGERADLPGVAALAEVIGRATVNDLVGRAPMIRVDPLDMAGAA